MNRRAQVHAVDGHQIINIVGHTAPQNHGDQQKLDDGFGQIDQGLGAEYAGESGHGIELAEFGRNHADRKNQPAAEHCRQNRYHHQQCHDRQDQHITIHNGLEKYSGQQLGLVHDLAVELQLRGKQHAQAVKNIVARQTEKQSGGDHHSRRRQFNRARQLPVLARLAQALRGRFFGPFCGVVSHGLAS